MTIRDLAFAGMSLGLALAMSAATGAQGAANPAVVIETTLGNITVELYADKAPLSVKNFLMYVKEGFYSGTIFHRVIKGFMIQGGGLTADMNRKPTKAAIKNEATNGLKNERGTIAMARTGEVDSATSQFFINTVSNRGLDQRSTKPEEFGYAVFGKVIDGMDVVDKIEGAPTTKPGDVPVTTVTIKAVRVKQ